MVFVRQRLALSILLSLSFCWWSSSSWAQEVEPQAPAPESEIPPAAQDAAPTDAPSAEQSATAEGEAASTQGDGEGTMTLSRGGACDGCEDCEDDDCECECDDEGECECEDDFDWGAFAGGFALGTRLDGQAAFISGFEVGPIFNHRFSVGFGAYGLFSQVDGPTYPTGAESIYGFGYIGFVARYYFRGDGPFYGSIGALAGPGGVTILERVSKNEFNWIESQSSGQEVFVAEPSLRFHWEPVRFFRMSAQGSYRFVKGVSDYELRDKDLSGFSLGLGLELGWF